MKLNPQENKLIACDFVCDKSCALIVSGVSVCVLEQFQHVKIAYKK